MWFWLLIQLSSAQGVPVSTATSLHVTDLAHAGLSTTSPSGSGLTASDLANTSLSVNSTSGSGVSANSLTSAGLQVDDLESV